MKKISLKFGALLFLFNFWTSSSASDIPRPEETVSEFQHTLTKVLKEKHYEAKLSLLLPSVSKLFAVDTIARISFGTRSWKLLNDNERKVFQTLTTNLIASTYAARFKEFKDQRFEINESISLRKNRHAVKTQLFSGEAAVSLEYHLQNKGSAWQIYDIVANGVSDLNLKRSAYGKTLAEIGFSGLVDDIKKEIKKNSEKSF